MPHILRDLHRATAQKPTHPALRCCPDSRHLPCNRVEAFAFTLSMRVVLDVVSHGEERRERIRQIQQRGGGDDADEAEVVWNCGRDDEGDGPPDGHDDGVEDFPTAGDERRCAEEIHEYVVVEDFDADVAV